jgi:hypothetical protein
MIYNDTAVVPIRKITRSNNKGTTTNNSKKKISEADQIAAKLASRRMLK